MLSVDYGFGTSFGGWPPSELLAEVVRHEGSSCPLFVLPVTTIARHVPRADQRRGTDVFDVALAPHRQRRLRRLCEIASGVAPCECSGTLRNFQGRRSSRPDCAAKEGDKDGDILGESFSAFSSGSLALSQTTEESSERGLEYEEGYLREQEVENAADRSRGGSLWHLHAAAASAPDRVVADAVNEVVVPPITVELLRQLRLAAGDRTAHNTPASLHLTKGRNAGHDMGKEAPSVPADTREVRGKHTVRPLRWQMIRPPVALRSRHGHHLVSCRERLYVISGCYWAHGNALASTDMMYDVCTGASQQISFPFPQRFCAALAKSDAVPATPWTMAGDEHQVLYCFGDLSYSHQLMHTPHRLWLPQAVLEELPQYGTVPRAQSKGILVCNVQRESTPDEHKRGEQATRRLFYMDGFQDGGPMAPYLVRSQISLLQYELVDTVSERPASEAARSAPVPVKQECNQPAKRHATCLRRFEVVGGMPARRGKQRRSRICYAFDTVQMRFDYAHALPAPGLTAHCVVLVPSAGMPSAAAALHSTVKAGEDRQTVAEGATLLSAYQTALRVLRERCGAWPLCCGGNEDWSDAEQNSLGKPVGWLYLLALRKIPLAEGSRVEMGRLCIQSTVLTMDRDGLLGTLF
ncbi:hypothetical protein CGC20_34580 [Leishmania donovani]|uniref:Uncharacterized protein n=1 Tax=Leishmania donovani TaxID=5661 RepID=A0A504XEF4_LEIDO|nr:hypothetical protein CGC20_34580 [Leishmania donovani]